MQMELEALTTAEPASEPVVYTAAESDSDDNLDEVELNEDPSEARNLDLAPLPATNVKNYARKIPDTLQELAPLPATNITNYARRIPAS
jgi:hypothetical protein